MLLMLALMLRDKYQFSTMMTGFSFLPFGAGAILGSWLAPFLLVMLREECGTGGKLIVPAASGLLFSISIAAFGLAVPWGPITTLICTFFVGLFTTLMRPGVLSFTQEISGDTSTPALVAAQMITAAITLSCAPWLKSQFGLQVVFGGIAVVSLVLTIPVACLVCRRY